MYAEHDEPSVGGDPSGAAERRFPVRAWFIPLEDPLNLPQGYILQLPRTRSPLDPLWFEDLHDQFRTVETMVSLKIWHVETSLTGVHEKADLAFEACKRAFPMYFGQESNEIPAEKIDWPDFVLPATVVETTVSIYRDDASNDDYAAALEEAIFEIQRLQRANGFVTGRPARPISLQSLPPYIPTATASVGVSGFRTDGDVKFYLLPQNMHQLPSRRDFDEVEMETFVSFFRRTGGVFGGFLASQSEARAAVLHRGDARSSLLASATACEVFLDDLLKHLLWEKRETPEDCLRIFIEGSAITTVQGRTRRELGNLVGGNWNDKTQPDLGNWQSQVAHLRHRTIHGGYIPTLEEAQKAIDVSDRLQGYAADVLATRLRDYPRTAVMLIGTRALEARGLLTKAVRRELTSGDPLDWHERFVRWRKCLAGLVERELEPFTPDEADAHLVGVTDGLGGVQFVRHHRDSGLAVRVQLLERSATIDRIEEAASAIPVGSQPISLAAKTDVPTRRTEEWVSEHRRLPLCGVMANGADFY